MVLLVAESMVARGRVVRLADSTDWWSISSGKSRRGGAQSSGKSLERGTFQIAGVALGANQFEKLAAKLGEAAIVERGDASTGRQQVCYAAAGGVGGVYLVFEFGEDESTFYLFTDGPDWNGRNLCVRSKLVSVDSATPSGLRLGLSRAQVEAILGKGDAVSAHKLVYSRQILERASPMEFQRLRSEYPEKLSDEVAHEKFDFYPVDIYVEARFSESGLNYLAVSKSAGLD